MATAVRPAPARAPTTRNRTRTGTPPTRRPTPARAKRPSARTATPARPSRAKVPAAGARTSARPRTAPAPKVRTRTRTRHHGLGLAALATVAALVLAVVFHVVLAQGQLELDHTANAISKAQQTYEKRRLAVARLSAPERIIGEAQRLGLVLPADPPTYLTVPGAPVPANDATAPSTASSDWKVVKPHLGDTQP